MLRQQDTLDFGVDPASCCAYTREAFPECQPFWSLDPPFRDPFLQDLIATRPVQRLRRIGFLGAIDYLVHGNGTEPHRRRHNRFDHSVNVALLALRYAAHRDLDQHERRVIAAAALLHDVGHGPLSHTLESVFRSRFGIDHHEAGKATMQGRSPLGGAIARACSAHNVDVDEIIELLMGTHDSQYAFLFSSPINVDTIEAISRCCVFASNNVPISPTHLVDAIATRDTFPTELVDHFWSIKETIYRTLIHSRIGTVADGFAQYYMLQAIDRFVAEDFFLDDEQLRRKHPQLFKGLEDVRRGASLSTTQRRGDVLEHEVSWIHRSFTVNSHVEIHSAFDLALRYTQKKDIQLAPIGSLMNTAGIHDDFRTGTTLGLCFGQEPPGCASQSARNRSARNSETP